MGRITRTVAVTKVSLIDGTLTVDTRGDTVTVEEPLEIRAQGHTLTTTMRTPGNDLELIHGWMYSEGMITEPTDIATARYCAGSVDGENTYNVMDVDVRHPIDPQFIRLTPTTSARGVCGTGSIESILHKAHAPIEPIALNPTVIMGLPNALRSGQKQFRKTGSIHAAGAFDAAGNPLVIREDIGRHNAADKVVGNLLLSGSLPATGFLLVVSSRASFELVQKAVMAGFSGLIALSGASSLAIELARETKMALTGFTSSSRFNVYSGDITR